MKTWAEKNQKPLLIALLLVLLCVFFIWIYKNITWEEIEVDRGYSKAALKNNYLAAELFLKQQGVDAISTKNLTLLDNFAWRNISLGAADTIILIDGHKTLSQTRYDKLMEWVENGGTLIASTQNPYIGDHTDAQDLLLNDFGIEIAPVATDIDKRDAMEKFADELEKLSEGDKTNKQDAGQNDAKENPENTEETPKKLTQEQKQQLENNKRCNKENAPATVSFYGEEEPLAFDFSQKPAFHYYNNSDEDEAAEPDIMHMVYFDVGEGSVVITSDNSIWGNKRIDCHDHAYGLWRLINPEGRVWFLINQDAPSLWTILWRTATYGALAALLALGLWLWAKYQRFGPVLVYEQPGRRSLAEHVYASTMLLWRKQQHPQLITLLRNDIIERLNQYHPLIAQASQNEQLAYLQQLIPISTNELQQALFAEDLLHPQAFTTAVACLQKIRKAL
jgi:hypothetical protein